MRKLFAVTVMAILLVSSTAFAVEAQTEDQGVIQALDPAGKTLTLTDGNTFVVSPSLSTEPLREGDEVTVVYTQNGGQKVMTAFWIDAGRSGESG